MKREFLLIMLVLSVLTSHAQTWVNQKGRIESGEFYLPSAWYWDSPYQRGCLIHFTQNGKLAEMTITDSLPIEYPQNYTDMFIGEILVDNSSGVLYNIDDLNSDKMYASFDNGHSWNYIDTLDMYYHQAEYWTFENEPGVLVKSRSNPSVMSISYDHGTDFNTLDVPFVEDYCVSGWHLGEFFKEAWNDDNALYLTHSDDFNQTADTVFLNVSFSDMVTGHEEGELYLVETSDDELSKTIYFSDDYGNHLRTLMVLNSVISDPGWEYFSFQTDQEQGVFYTIKNELTYINNYHHAKKYIDYYRANGDTLVTTYFHDFDRDWMSHHTPVMDCEVTSCTGNSITLRWSEPEMKPEEQLTGYEVYRGTTLVNSVLINETEYTDSYSAGGSLEYHVLAVYSDNGKSKSYNIAYCKQNLGVSENESTGIFTLYPNPARDVITIEGAEIVEIEVLNITGQKIETIENSNTLNVSKYPAGVYCLRIKDKDGRCGVGRVEKR